MFFDQEEIYRSTNDGLEIIFWLYPDAVGCDESKNKKFKVRTNEKTASAVLSYYKGLWWVTDYGVDSKPRNAIQCVMDEQHCDFKEALEIIAQHFRIQPKDGTLPPEKAKYHYAERPATDDELPGQYYYTLKKEISLPDLKSIFTDKVLQFALDDAKRNNKNQEPDDLNKRYKICIDTLTRYHIYAAESYKYVKERTTKIYTATDEHPIFIIAEKEFFKIYQPLHPDKRKRFYWGGDKPTYFVHGLHAIELAYQNMNENNDQDYEQADDDEKEVKRKEKKLSGIVLCSGGSDAVNVAAVMGHEFACVWFNSESQHMMFDTYRYFKTRAKNIYNLPDIDYTGRKHAHELALQYMDMKTIELPAELTEKKDKRRNPCKDVRDYLANFSISSFKKLIDTALEYQFWKEKIEYNRKGDPVMIDGKPKIGYEVSNVHLYNFLEKNGYHKFKMQGRDEDFFVSNTGNIIELIDTRNIRSYINTWLKKNHKPFDLRNAFFRSTQMSESSMQNLKTIDINFKDYGRDFQYMFFKNKVWKITGNEITEYKHGEQEIMVWKEDVIPHRVDLKDEMFTITYDRANDLHDITIHNTDGWFMCYLINASRIFWRDEMENFFDGGPDGLAKEYAEQNKFNIAGPNLTPEQVSIQKQHLINKIYSIGYLLHRYKDASRAWWVFAIDNKISDAGEAHGGSGKSICYEKAIRMILQKSFYLDGRNSKMTDNPHMLEGLTEYHRYLIIDDAHKHLNFGRFFGMITGETEVNPKGKSKYSIPFEKSPKGCITMNYVLKHNDPSTERRLLYTVFSDYYHYNKDNEYRQTRTVADDFDGRQMFTDFDNTQWNLFLNFAAQCLKFYLSCTRKVDPPMDNVSKRQMLDAMGETFREWADEYFAETENQIDCRLNKLLPKRDLLDDFNSKYKTAKFSTQRFTMALKTFARYNKLIYNPKELQDRKGRILRNHEGRTTEMVCLCSNLELTIQIEKKTYEPEKF